MTFAWQISPAYEGEIKLLQMKFNLENNIYKKFGT
jgi:hypothetical protein